MSTIDFVIFQFPEFDVEICCHCYTARHILKRSFISVLRYLMTTRGLLMRLTSYWRHQHLSCSSFIQTTLLMVTFCYDLIKQCNWDLETLAKGMFWILSTDHSGASRIFERGAGRWAAAGPRGPGVNWPPTFSGAGSTYGAWPLTLRTQINHLQGETRCPCVSSLFKTRSRKRQKLN